MIYNFDISRQTLRSRQYLISLIKDIMFSDDYVDGDITDIMFDVIYTKDLKYFFELLIINLVIVSNVWNSVNLIKTK